MEAYGNNSVVKVLGKFHVFLRWKGRVYRQLFYVTDANNSPNLLSRDGCYTLGVIKPCYSVESMRNFSKFQAIPEVTPTQPTVSLEKTKLQGDSFNHCGNEGIEMVKQTDPKKPSIEKDELQGAPLMKARVLDVYSDIFTGIGKFTRRTLQVPAQTKCKTCKTCTNEGSNSSAGHFPKGNQEFGMTWNS